MQIISATDLARKTREVLADVLGRGETVIVQRNRMTIARILPPKRVMTAAQALSDLRPMLTTEQADAWLEESRADFDEAVRDPWV